MTPASRRLRWVLIGAAVLISLPAAYWAGYDSGYRAGLSDKGPQRRALVVVRRTKGNPNSLSRNYRWFDISNRSDAARLAQEEQRLKAIGAEYYIAKGVVETKVRPEPDPRRVNSHR